MATRPEPPGQLSPLKAFLVLAVIAVLLTAYVVVCALVGIGQTYGGLLLVFCWTTVERSEVGRLSLSVVGALAGVGAAYAAHRLLDLHGWVGPAVALGLVGGLVYILLLKRLAVLVNDGCMLQLTVGLIPAVQKQEAYGQIAASVLVAAAFMAAGIGVFRFVSGRKAVDPLAAE